MHAEVDAVDDIRLVLARRKPRRLAIRRDLRQRIDRRAVRLFVRGGEHDSFECSCRLFERPCRQRVSGVCIPFVYHLPGDAVERGVSERLVEPTQYDSVASVGPAG